MNKIDLEEILIFVDEHGYTVSKHSSPVSNMLHMEYDDSSLNIEMEANSFAMGNGYCWAKVIYRKNIVYEACGSFTVMPFNVKVKAYKAGKWEKIIKTRKVK